MISNDRRSRRLARLQPKGLFTFALAGTAVLLSVLQPATAAAPMQLTYRVSHTVFGDIGTYSNSIQPTADGTTVSTRADLQVKVLGISLFREDAQRTEHWRGNRLVAFHGVTNKVDGTIEVRGEARGNSFVITSPQGTTTAPAMVRPANPWSANFLGSNTMMRPDSGKLEQVRVSGAQETRVNVDGVDIPARKYEVDGETKYSVWLDGRGVPVMFVVDDNSGKVTFTLARCDHCDVSVSYLAPK